MMRAPSSTSSTKTVNSTLVFCDTAISTARSGLTLSSRSKPSGSAKEDAASSNEMPCFLLLLAAFLGSHSNLTKLSVTQFFQQHPRNIRGRRAHEPRSAHNQRERPPNTAMSGDQGGSKFVCSGAQSRKRQRWTPD